MIAQTKRVIGRDSAKAPRIKHVRLPDDPNVAYCGAIKPPTGKRFYWHEMDERDVCVVCLSFPGAREWASS